MNTRVVLHNLFCSLGAFKCADAIGLPNDSANERPELSANEHPEKYPPDKPEKPERYPPEKPERYPEEKSRSRFWEPPGISRPNK